MQNICLSLLKTIQEYEEVINEAASGPQGIYIYKLEICCVLLWRGTDEKSFDWSNSKLAIEILSSSLYNQFNCHYEKTPFSVFMDIKLL